MIVDVTDHLKQFVRRVLAEETEVITGGAVGWRDLPEMRIEKVQSDRFLVIRRPHLLAHLAAPWPEAQPHAEVMIEVKPTGSHLDRLEVERALLLRQARQVERLDEDASWLGQEPLWLVASHVPGWVEEKYRPERFAPGCYRVDSDEGGFLWIAANELPLLDELIPLLLARSGPALDELARWIAVRRPVD